MHQATSILLIVYDTYEERGDNRDQTRHLLYVDATDRPTNAQFQPKRELFVPTPAHAKEADADGSCEIRERRNRMFSYRAIPRGGGGGGTKHHLGVADGPREEHRIQVDVHEVVKVLAKVRDAKTAEQISGYTSFVAAVNSKAFQRLAWCCSDRKASSTTFTRCDKEGHVGDLAASGPAICPACLVAFETVRFPCNITHK